jgi:tetratricopeptide (TPR) repeat protein
MEDIEKALEELRADSHQWQEFVGIENSDDCVLRKASALARVLVSEQTVWAVERLQSSGTQFGIRKDDRRWRDVYYDHLLYYMHIADREAFEFLGERRRIFVHRLGTEVAEMCSLEFGNDKQRVRFRAKFQAAQFKAKFFKNFNLFQDEFGRYKRERSVPLGEQLQFRFAKRIASRFGCGSDIRLISLVLGYVTAAEVLLNIPGLLARDKGIGPNDAVAHTNLGNAYKNQGKIDDAIGEYKEALRLDPGLALAHNNLGSAYRDQGKIDDAIGEYKEALRIDPNLAEAHNNLGATYHGQGRLDNAIGEYKEALRIAPNNAMAHNNLGLAYQDQGKLDAAIREYKEALRIDPTLAEAHNNLGLAYRDQGKLDAAMREFKEALRLNPNYADSHYNLGIAYHAQGKLDAAMREYKEVLRLNPNDADLHCNLGSVYASQGKFDVAIREYKEALRLNPNDADLHYNLGSAYTSQGKFKEAVECYQEFVGLAGPEHAPSVSKAEKLIRELERRL